MVSMFHYHIISPKRLYSQSAVSRNRKLVNNVKDNLPDVKMRTASEFSGLVNYDKKQLNRLHRPNLSIVKCQLESPFTEALDNIHSDNNNEYCLNNKPGHSQSCRKTSMRNALGRDFPASTDIVSNVAREATDAEPSKVLHSKVTNKHCSTDSRGSTNKLAYRFDDAHSINKIKDEKSPNMTVCYHTQTPRFGKQTATNVAKKCMAESKFAGEIMHRASIDEANRLLHEKHLNSSENLVPEACFQLNVDEATSDLLSGDFSVILNKYYHKRPTNSIQETKTEAASKCKIEKCLSTSNRIKNANVSFQSADKHRVTGKMNTHHCAHRRKNKCAKKGVAVILQETPLKTIVHEECLLSSTSSWSTSLTMHLAQNMKSRKTVKEDKKRDLRARRTEVEYNRINHTARKAKISTRQNKNIITDGELVNTHKEVSNTRVNKFSSGLSLLSNDLGYTYPENQIIYCSAEFKRQKLCDIPQIPSSEGVIRQCSHDNKRQLASFAENDSTALGEGVSNFFSLSKDVLAEIKDLYNSSHKIPQDLQAAMRRNLCADKFWPYEIPVEHFTHNTLPTDHDKCALSDERHSERGITLTPYSPKTVTSSSTTHRSCASNYQILSQHATSSNTSSATDVLRSDLFRSGHEMTVLKPAALEFQQQQRHITAEDVHLIQNVHSTNVPNATHEINSIIKGFPHKCMYQVLQAKPMATEEQSFDQDKQNVPSQPNTSSYNSIFMVLPQNLIPSVSGDINRKISHSALHTLASTVEKCDGNKRLDYSKNKSILRNKLEESMSLLTASTVNKNRCLAEEVAFGKSTELDANSEHKPAVNIPPKEHLQMGESESQQAQTKNEEIRCRRKSLIPRHIKTTPKTTWTKQKLAECKRNCWNSKIDFKHCHGEKGSSNIADSRKATSLYNQFGKGLIPTAGTGRISLGPKITMKTEHRSLNSDKYERGKHKRLINGPNGVNINNAKKQVYLHTFNNAQQDIRLGQRNNENIPVAQRRVNAIVPSERPQKALQSQMTQPQASKKPATHCIGMEHLKRAVKCPVLVPSRTRSDRLDSTTADLTQPTASRLSAYDSEWSLPKQNSSIKSKAPKLVTRENADIRDAAVGGEMFLRETGQRIREEKNNLSPHSYKEAGIKTEDSQCAESQSASSGNEGISLLALTTLNHRLVSSSPITCLIPKAHSQMGATCVMGNIRQMTVNNQNIMSNRLQKSQAESCLGPTVEALCSNCLKLPRASTGQTARNPAVRSRSITKYDQLTAQMLPAKHAQKLTSENAEDACHRIRLSYLGKEATLRDTNNKLSPGYNYNKSSNIVDETVNQYRQKCGTQLEESGCGTRSDGADPEKLNTSAKNGEPNVLTRNGKSDKPSELLECRRAGALPLSTVTSTEKSHEHLLPRFHEDSGNKQAAHTQLLCSKGLLDSPESTDLSKIRSPHNIKSPLPGYYRLTYSSKKKISRKLLHISPSYTSQRENVNHSQPRASLAYKDRYIHEHTVGQERKNINLANGGTYENLTSSQRAKHEDCQQNQSRCIAIKTDMLANADGLSLSRKRPTNSTRGQGDTSKLVLINRNDKYPHTNKNRTLSISKSVKERMQFADDQGKKHAHKPIHETPRKPSQRKFASDHIDAYDTQSKNAIIKEADTEDMKDDKHSPHMPAKTKYNNVTLLSSQGRNLLSCKSKVANVYNASRSSGPKVSIIREVGSSQENQTCMNEDKASCLLRSKSLPQVRPAMSQNQCNSSTLWLKKIREHSQARNTETEPNKIESKGLIKGSTCQFMSFKSSFHDNTGFDQGIQKTRCEHSKMVHIQNKLDRWNKAALNLTTRHKEVEPHNDVRTPQGSFSTIEEKLKPEPQLFVTTLSPTLENFQRHQQSQTFSRNHDTLFSFLTSSGSTCSMRSKKSMRSCTPPKTDYSPLKVNQTESVTCHFTEIECPGESTCRRTKLVRVVRDEGCTLDSARKNSTNFTAKHDNKGDQLFLTREMDETGINAAEHKEKTLSLHGDQEADSNAKIRNDSDNTCSLCGFSSPIDYDIIEHRSKDYDPGSQYNSPALMKLSNIFNLHKSKSSPDTRENKTMSVIEENQKCLPQLPVKQSLSHFINLQRKEDAASPEPVKRKAGYKAVPADNQFSRNVSDKYNSTLVHPTSVNHPSHLAAQLNRQVKLKIIKESHGLSTESSLGKSDDSSSRNISNLFLSPFTSMSSKNSYSLGLPKMLSISAGKQDIGRPINQSQQFKNQPGVIEFSSREQEIICKKDKQSEEYISNAENEHCDPKPVRKRKKCEIPFLNPAGLSRLTTSEQQNNGLRREVTSSNVPARKTLTKLNQSGAASIIETTDVKNDNKSLNTAFMDLPKSCYKVTKESKSEYSQPSSLTSDNSNKKVQAADQKNSEFLTRAYMFGYKPGFRERFLGRKKASNKQDFNNITDAPITEVLDSNVAFTDSSGAKSELILLLERLKMHEKGASLCEANLEYDDHVARSTSIGDGNTHIYGNTENANKDVHLDDNAERKQRVVESADSHSYQHNSSKLSEPVSFTRKILTEKSFHETQLNNKLLGKYVVQRRTRIPGNSRLTSVHHNTKNNSTSLTSANEYQINRLQERAALHRRVCGHGSVNRSSLRKPLRSSRSSFSKTMHARKNSPDNKYEDSKRKPVCKQNSKFKFSIASTQKCNAYKSLKKHLFHFRSSANQQDTGTSYPRNLTNQQVGTADKVRTRDRVASLKKEHVEDMEATRAAFRNSAFKQVSGSIVTNPGVTPAHNPGSRFHSVLAAQSSNNKLASQCLAFNPYGLPQSDVSLQKHHSLHTDTQQDLKDDHVVEVNKMPISNTEEQHKHYFDVKRLSESEKCKLSMTGDKLHTTNANIENITFQAAATHRDNSHTKTTSLSSDTLRSNNYVTSKQKDFAKDYQHSPDSSCVLSVEKRHSSQKLPVIGESKRKALHPEQITTSKFFPAGHAGFSFLKQNTFGFGSSGGCSPTHRKLQTKNPCNLRVRPVKENSFVGKIVKMFENNLTVLTPGTETNKKRAF